MPHPDHTTTFAFCTLGRLLLHRHHLAMALHQRLYPDAPLWSYQAFALAPAIPHAEPTVDLRHASLDDPRAVPLDHRILAIKALAALLRFAYLADLPIHSIRVPKSNRASDESQMGHLFCSLFDGQDLELQLVAEPSGGLVLLQSGVPSSWFDPDRWTALAPLHRSAPEPAPLSQPGRFSWRHAAVLRTLGAVPARRDLWLPPPASAIDDLVGFVAQTAQLPAPRTFLGALS